MSLAWLLLLFMTTTPTNLERRLSVDLQAQLPPGVTLQSLRVTSSAKTLPPPRQLHDVRLASPVRQGRAHLQLSYQDDQGRVLARWVKVQIDQCAQVWVAARDLKTGQVVASQDMLRQERCSLDSDQVVAKAKLAIGGTLRRAVRKGAVLSPTQIIPRPAVQRGETVALVWRRGGVEIRGEAKALDNAALGQRLRLQRAGHQRPLRAVLIAPGLAELSP